MDDIQDSDDSLDITDSDSDDDELMMLKDEYDEIKNPKKFGKIFMKPSSEEKDLYEIFARDTFYLPPFIKKTI